VANPIIGFSSDWPPDAPDGRCSCELLQDVIAHFRVLGKNGDDDLRKATSSGYLRSTLDGAGCHGRKFNGPARFSCAECQLVGVLQELTAELGGGAQVKYKLKHDGYDAKVEACAQIN
jgi:hypothetical protein